VTLESWRAQMASPNFTQENRSFYNYYFVRYPDPAYRALGPRPKDSPNEPGIVFHGAIGAATALDPSFSHRAKILRSAVVCAERGPSVGGRSR
jgi:hypothetical protein